MRASRTSKPIFALAAAIATVTVASACGKDTTGPVVPSAITLVAGNGQSGVVGQALPNPFVVKVTDASGAVMPGVTVTWSLGGGGGSVSASSTTTDPSGQGMATLTLGLIAGANTVSATVGQLAPIVFSATGVAGTPAKLGLSLQPSNVVAGTAISPAVQVTVQDAQGNTVTNSTASVTLAITSGTGTTGAVLGGTLTQTAVNGVATFANLAIDKAGTGYTLTATATGLTSATSTAFNLTAAGASQLALITSAAGAVSGAAFATQPVVAIRDASGNTVTSSGIAVRMTVSAGASVVGVATVAASSGVVTFTNAGIGGTAGRSYTLTFAAAGLTSAAQSITPTAGARVYKNYLRTSYELSKYDLWLSSADLVDSGHAYTAQNPLQTIQTAQVDIDGDGLEDILTYDSYSMNQPLSSTPPSVFMNTGTALNKVAWSGPSLREPHGVKLLVGDFNGDGLPDVFSLVAVDPPGGGFPDLQDFNNLLFDSPTGFATVKEFDDQRGFWFTGASGDIDNDGDLDIVMFNFHVGTNGVQSKILWNDGRGNFSYDPSGIGNILIVDLAELADVNGDGYLDLVINHIDAPNGQRTNHVVVMWGNGQRFGLDNSTTFPVSGDKFMLDIGFTDIDADGFQELVLSGVDQAGNYYIEIYKSDDRGTSFINRTADFVDNNISTRRFDHIRVQDIDKNGMMDIFAPDRRDNIRWEWNGTKFIKR